MAKINPYDQICPVAQTMEIVGDRWTMLIIRDLFLGKARFGELLKSSPGMPPKLLSSRLKRLEDDRLVERILLDGYPPRAEYRLTERGRSLFPIFREVVNWGLSQFFGAEPELRHAIEEMVADRVPEYTRP